MVPGGRLSGPVSSGPDPFLAGLLSDLLRRVKSPVEHVQFWMVIVSTVVPYFCAAQGARVPSDVPPFFLLEELVEGRGGLLYWRGPPLALFLWKTAKGRDSFGIGAVVGG